VKTVYRMVDITLLAVSFMVGLLTGIVSSPLLYVGYSSLYSTAEAVNQDVEGSEEP